MNERIIPFAHRVIEPLKRFLRGPYALLAAIGVVLVIGALALHEHDARLHRSFELQQLKSETATRVKELEERAAAALQAANQRNARVIRELEASRLKLAKEGDKLRQRLAALERDERVRVERVATLPSNELVQRVATRLDAGPLRTGTSGQGTGDSEKSGHPVIGSSGHHQSPDQPITQSLDLRPAEHPATPAEGPTLTLDPDALRSVETAFVELEACREQAAVRDERVANCREQLASSAAIAGRLDDSLRELNQAIRLKEEILARREAEHRAELKAARGSRWERMRKALTYVGVGVVVGVVVAR